MAKEASDDVPDPRIAFSQATGKWIFEDDETGAEYEYDEELGQWNPVPDKEELDQQQKAYERSKGDEKKRPRREHEEEEEEGEDKHSSNKKAKQQRPTSAVYISGLPLDITEDEIEQSFSKFGVIAEDLKTGDKKIRVYKDEKGRLKGDGLVIYFKPESVPLAIDMMDDTKLRPGDEKPVKVQKADYSYKKNDKNSDDKNGTEEASSENKRKQLTATEKRKIQKLNDKLADWDEDDERLDTSPKKNPRVVVLKYVFTLKELEDDVTAALDIKEDIREGCEDIGPVTNVVLYDKEPEGIVTVKFKTESDALRCVQRMNGRYFGGQALEADLQDMGVKYKKSQSSNKDIDDDNNDNNEENSRLERFGQWLEEGS